MALRSWNELLDYVDKCNTVQSSGVNFFCQCHPLLCADLCCYDEGSLVLYDGGGPMNKFY